MSKFTVQPWIMTKGESALDQGMIRLESAGSFIMESEPGHLPRKGDMIHATASSMPDALRFINVRPLAWYGNVAEVTHRYSGEHAQITVVHMVLQDLYVRKEDEYVVNENQDHVQVRRTYNRLIENWSDRFFGLIEGVSVI